MKSVSCRNSKPRIICLDIFRINITLRAIRWAVITWPSDSIEGNTRQGCEPFGPLCLKWSRRERTCFFPGWFFACDNWVKVESSLLFSKAVALRIFNVTSLSSLERALRNRNTLGPWIQGLTCSPMHATLWKIGHMTISRQFRISLGIHLLDARDGSRQVCTPQRVQRRRWSSQSDACRSMRWEMFDYGYDEVTRIGNHG